MYNFNLLKNEKLIQVFDDIWIKEGNNEKVTTIALTNERLLFLDYEINDPRENLRIINKLNYIKTKEVYYSINLEDIKDITKKDNYIIHTINNKNIEIDNERLGHLIKKQKEKTS